MAGHITRCFFLSQSCKVDDVAGDSTRYFVIAKLQSWADKLMAWVMLFVSSYGADVFLFFCLPL